jgi:predicted ATPase
VQSLVQARVDRLAAEHKEALQAASVLGQRFAAGALAHLLGGMDRVPEFLMGDRLIWRRGDAFSFAHALIRDAIYDSLLKSRRRAMHRRAADWYADRDPVLYAEHLEHASDPQAAQAYLAAARSQAAEYRHEHALRLVERGLAVACKNADASALAYLQGDLLRDSGSLLSAAAAYEKALNAADDFCPEVSGRDWARFRQTGDRRSGRSFCRSGASRARGCNSGAAGRASTDPLPAR